MTPVYFRVIGISGKDQYLLGYTSSPKAWARHSNGWELENLRFIPMLGKHKERGRK